MEVLGDPSGVKMAQDASWIASGLNLETSWDHLVAKMAQVGPKWRQDGAMLVNLEAKMVNLAPFGEASWVIFQILSAIFTKIAEV